MEQRHRPRNHAELVDGPILVRIATIEHLFNPMDPSPLDERALDEEVADWIEEWAEDLDDDQPLAVEIHVAAGVGPEREQAAVAGLRSHFEYREWQADRRLHKLLREGRISLVIGLMACSTRASPYSAGCRCGGRSRCCSTTGGRSARSDEPGVASAAVTSGSAPRCDDRRDPVTFRCLGGRDGMTNITFGRQTTGALHDAAAREWLLTDGLGGFAMGTVAGLRTRRYHGLLVVATEPPIGRRLGLAALDAVVVIGDRRIELATHEWASGAIAPSGHRLLDRFDLVDGVPRWQWSAGPVVVQAELAMTRGRPGVVMRWSLLSAPDAVTVEVGALCTWRDVHGERYGDGDPVLATAADGFVFEDAFRVAGPGFRAAPAWYRGVRHREEAARGLNATEDLFRVGHFVATIEPGESVEVSAWATDLATPLPPAVDVIDAARARARSVAVAAGASDDDEALLAHAADQFVVTGGTGPTVVAGYPWFGDWSRDTMTSYEGLFLETGRADEGRDLLVAAAGTVSEGMLANTADAGGTEYNTVDAAMWFLHAIGRHVERTGDLDLGKLLLPTIDEIVQHHLRGTRFGIRVDDGLVTQGADGWALTWMDARVDGRPITRRSGKPVEVNALWIGGLGTAARIAAETGGSPEPFAELAARAAESFERRFARPGGGWLDVVDGPGGDQLRPNQIVARAVLGARSSRISDRELLEAVEPLRTSIGLRSLADTDPGYIGRHRGAPAERDAGYHQGTVWPWLLGSVVDVLVRSGERDGAHGVVESAMPHLREWGLGSVSETADGDPPHDATGCPYQAWSVAEWLRASRCARR